MSERIYITGIGVVCSAGANAQQFALSLKNGTRGFVALEDERLSQLRATHAGLVGHLDDSGFSMPPDFELDRHVKLALLAASEALTHAGLTAPLGQKTAIVFGTCSGGMNSIEDHYEALLQGDSSLTREQYFSKQYHSAAKTLAFATGANGPVQTVVTACAAGAGAFAAAPDLIRNGLADVVLAGGGDAFSPSTLVGFDALKATCEGMCAPFSVPVGLNLGEGAAFFVLEKADHALKRGATIIGELLGSGLSNDAHHPTAPDPSGKGQQAAMVRALEDANISPTEICYINAHGTGTRANDSSESRAVGRVFGERVQSIPISSTKSIIGHCLGGAGALEAAATLLGAQEGFTPPTAGYDGPREGCELDYVIEPGRPWPGRYALSNSFGFAGNNACLVFDTDPNTDSTDAPQTEQVTDPIVITGTGTVSALGYQEELVESPEMSQDATVRRVPQLDVRSIDRRLDLKGMDLSSVYTTLAVRGALSESRFKIRPSVTDKIGLVLGLANGSAQAEHDHLTTVFENDFNLQSVGAFPYVVPNAVAGNAARALTMRGYNTVLCTGAGAGLVALINATMAVRCRHAQTIVAGSVDELTERYLADIQTIGRHVDSVPGEGAAALTVETLSTAQNRGAKPIAEILGYALYTDASDLLAGDPKQALTQVLQQSIQRAGIEASQVQTVAVANQSHQDTVLQLFGSTTHVVSLTDKLGYAQGTLPLFHLAHLIHTIPAGATAASVSCSPEGLAACVIIRKV